MKLFIGTPCRSGNLCAEFVVSLTNTVKALTAAGIEVRWETLLYSSFIQSARNKLAARFMASDYTDLLFIDDDMGWDLGGLLRMLTADVDVVGAICPKKTDPIEWVVNLNHDIATGKPVENAEGLYLCGHVGGALLRIKRNVFERMSQPWFDVEGAVDMGEDAWFCRKWREHGGKVWAAPYVEVTHTGQKVWRGRYSDGA